MFTYEQFNVQNLNYTCIDGIWSGPWVQAKGMFSFIAQARLQIVTMLSCMVVLDVVYPYIKVQVSIIGLMFPQKSSQWPLALRWDQEGGKGWGYTFASMLSTNNNW
jgi:hypothetical protein